MTSKNLKPAPRTVSTAAAIPWLGGGTAAALGGPWWATVLALALASLTAALQLVFPQNSADRLAWWRSLWERPRPRRYIARGLSRHAKR